MSFSTQKPLQIFSTLKKLMGRVLSYGSDTISHVFILEATDSNNPKLPVNLGAKSHPFSELIVPKMINIFGIL